MIKREKYFSGEPL